MSYTSIIFPCFLILVISLYFLCPNKSQWIVLLLSSFLFYLYANAKYFIFLTISILSTFYAALLIDKIKRDNKKQIHDEKEFLTKEEKKVLKQVAQKKIKLTLIAALFVNLGVLCFLKYYNFSVSTLNRFLKCKIPGLTLFLPLGISFYTFQALGYVIDVYRGDISAEKNCAKYALFISFFPQIVQGPIGRYNQLAEQLCEPHHFSWKRFKFGFELMLWGYLKKMVIADRFAIYISTLKEHSNGLNGTALTIMLIIYSIQLYADFSGGIDISRGFAQILGIEMEQNFRQPYFAVTLSDFWSRWHISLGTWMKNYVFYPLALSETSAKITKKIRSSHIGKFSFGKHLASTLPAAFSTLIVFIIVGIWHGAEWRYVLFGLYNGAIMMISAILKPGFEKLRTLLHIKRSVIFRIFQSARTFILVLISNITDVTNGASEFPAIVKKIFLNQHVRSGYYQVLDVLYDNSWAEFFLWFAGIVLFVVGLVKECNPEKSLREIIDSKSCVVEWLLVFLCAVMILCFGMYGLEYNPADFIYMQF